MSKRIKLADYEVPTLFFLITVGILATIVVIFAEINELGRKRIALIAENKFQTSNAVELVLIGAFRMCFNSTQTLGRYAFNVARQLPGHRFRQ